MELSANEDAQPIALQTFGIQKHFGATHALRGIDFTLHRREVHALLGENGAGKSTFVKILSGAHSPDDGSISIRGHVHPSLDPATSLANGISTIYQHSAMFPALSVVENVFSGHMIHGRWGTLDWSQMERKTKEIFQLLQIDIPVRRQLQTLDKATVQLVGIAKALSRDADIILMDEPTAALSSEEVERLFEIILRLRDAEKSIIYISHYVDEVLKISDRITVFREGRIVGSDAKENVDRSWIVQKMIGQKIANLYERTHRAKGEQLLEVHRLSKAGAFQDVSFSVHEGEVVAIVGLFGSGATEVLSAAYGLGAVSSRSVRVGDDRHPRRPWDMRDEGIGLIPADRTGQGIFQNLTASQNLMIASTKSVSRLGLMDRKKVAETSAQIIDNLSIFPRDQALKASSFSGGNQQKLVIGKWIATSPRVLFMNEPTQGVDIGAKVEIYRLVDSLVRRGMGVVMASSDLNEVAGLADRILIMYSGHLIGELAKGSSVQDITNAINGFIDRENQNV